MARFVDFVVLVAVVVCRLPYGTCVEGGGFIVDPVTRTNGGREGRGSTATDCSGRGAVVAHSDRE